MPANIIKQFFLRLGLFLLPFICFIIFYAILDPFYVIHRPEHPQDFHWNRSVESSRLYIKNNPHYHYTSFIIGNSKCMAFMSREWGKYINDSIPFHFDASSEDINGIYAKLKFLDETGNPLKNVLLVTDPVVYNGTGMENSFGYNEDYKVDGGSTLIFHYIYFSGFISNFFFINYIDYAINHTYRSYMYKTIPSDWSQYTYDTITNDWILQKRIASIKADSIHFYSDTKMFYKRDENPVPYIAYITPECLSILQKIKEIFNKHKTAYKIILSPVYAQRKTNPSDVAALKELFGANNVFDFSGKNSYSNCIGNYFDHNHYKQFIGAQLLSVIYHKDSTSLIH